MKHALCPRQTSDKEQCVTEMRAEGDRSELQHPSLVRVTAALGADLRLSVFPAKRGPEVYSSPLGLSYVAYCCTVRALL